MNNILANDIHQRRDKREHYTQLIDHDLSGRALRGGDNGERLFVKGGKEFIEDGKKNTGALR